MSTNNNQLEELMEEKITFTITKKIYRHLTRNMQNLYRQGKYTFSLFFESIRFLT